MPRPDGAHVLVARELAAGGLLLRGGNRGALVGRQRERGFLVAAGEAQHRAGDAVLLLRGKGAERGERVVEECRHGALLSGFGRAAV